MTNDDRFLRQVRELIAGQPEVTVSVLNDARSAW
jgi:hypothetical protein